MKLKPQQLNKRQEIILDIIDKKSGCPISVLFLSLTKRFSKVAKITVIRDLNKLLKLNFVKKIGGGRGTVYELSEQYNLLKPIDVDKYFKIAPDKREAKKSFNFEIIQNLKNIFTADEEKYLKQLTEEYQGNIKKISRDIFKKEIERLTIELSWKSSLIEGNTYTLLETEALIVQGKQAKGHKKEEAAMILNHKKALDYIGKNNKSFKKISIVKLEDVHRILTRNLRIARGIRKSIVGITGTVYNPLDNVFQIKEVLDKACKIVNQEKNIFAKAIILMLLIAYIQPFNDGNKRTSRLIANAILLAYNVCPLSYRSVDEAEYKKAVILFYEQNNLNYFKQLFIEQFEFAVKNYFRAD